jgi:hypothetical protein
MRWRRGTSMGLDANTIFATFDQAAVLVQTLDETWAM